MVRAVPWSRKVNRVPLRVGKAGEELPGFAEPVMGEPPSVAAVAAFLGEASVGLPPRLELQPPGDRVAGLVDGGEFPGEGEQAPAGIGAGVQREVAADVHLHVERTDPFVMLGEIVWLDTSVEGQRLGEAVLRRESE